MSKEGLVAPVWSDSGEVTSETSRAVSWEPCDYGWKLTGPYQGLRFKDWAAADCAETFDRVIQKPSSEPSHTVTINVTNTKEWKSREEWENILRAWVRKEIVPQALEILPGLIRKASDKPAKPSDPNAKPSLPALTRESGNKRGPGWCDE